MIVVDASALAAFVLKEEGWERLARHLLRSVSVDHVVKEAANALWKAAYLRGLLSAEEAGRAYRILMRLVGKNIVLLPELDYLDRALRIALELGLTVYDALYLALAAEKGLPLLSLDERQRRAAEELGLAVKP